MLINIKSLHPTLLSLYRVLMLCLEQWYCVVNKCTLPLLLAECKLLVEVEDEKGEKEQQEDLTLEESSGAAA